MKSAVYDNKFQKDNWIKLSELHDFQKNINNLRDKKYYENEARECYRNIFNYEGNIKDEEAKTRKFLVTRYNLDMIQSLKKSRFRDIYQCLKEYEREMEIDEGIFNEQ